MSVNANDDDSDACTATCEAAACGDGLVQPPEAWDDGNRIDDDVCSSALPVAAPCAGLASALECQALSCRHRGGFVSVHTHKARATLPRDFHSIASAVALAFAQAYIEIGRAHV